MPLRFARRLTAGLTALLAIGLVAGCADWFYERRSIPPEGTSSQACLERCARLLGECEARQTLREEECAARVSAAKAHGEACLRSGSAPCPPPGSCLGADMSICRQQSEECILACGGRVERRLRPDPWRAPVQDGTPFAKPQPG